MEIELGLYAYDFHTKKLIDTWEGNDIETVIHKSYSFQNMHNISIDKIEFLKLIKNEIPLIDMRGFCICKI